MSNIPKLRFKEFSGEWEEKRYGDIYSFYSTNSLSRDKLNYENGSVKNIHYGDIHTKFNTMFHIQNEKVPFINNEVDLLKIKNESYCRNGDLVIADASEDYNDIGKTMEIINLNNEKVIAGLHTFLARPNKYDMALGFTGYLLQSWKVRKQVMTIAQGTKVLSLSTGRLSKVKLDLPQKQEQEKIASFLTSVDTKIEQLISKEELLQQYKKGVMQKIFNQEIRFKADDGGEFGDWEVKKIGEIFKFKQGVQCGVENQFLQQSNGQIRFIRIVDVTSDEEPIRYIENPGSEYQVMEDDLFMVRYGAAGVVGYGYSGVLANNLFRFLPINQLEIKNKFYFFLFNYMKHKFEQLAGSSTMPALNFKSLNTLIIIQPSFKEQTKIANFLSSIDKKIELVTTQLEQTKEFKKGLLQQMFV